MGASAKRSILIVDDDPELVATLDVELGRLGFEVIAATDGIDALSYLYATRPSLVLIDLMMPRMTGLELVQQIRHDRGLRDLPLLVMSGAKELLGQAREAGADEVLLKPIDTDRVLQALARHGVMKA